MGGLSSGRRPHWGGVLKQVGLKFPVFAEWFLLAKRIANYQSKSFNEYVRDLVYKDVQHWKHQKLWQCECVNDKGKIQLNFKRKHYCNFCGQYQTEHHKQLYNK